MKSKIYLLALLLASALLAVYLIGIDYAPAPFFLDEFLVQAEVIKKAWLNGGGNNSWIIIQHGNMGGYFSYGPYVFIASIFAKVNGVSIFSSRLPGALFALLTGIFIYFTLRILDISKEFSLLGPVFYLLMPTVIVQSRVAWDPSMYPLICTGGAFVAEVAFSRTQYWRSGHLKGLFISFGITGFLAGLICWVYPAGRLTGLIFTLFCCIRITLMSAKLSVATAKQKLQVVFIAFSGLIAGLTPAVLSLFHELNRIEGGLDRTNGELIFGSDNIIARILSNYTSNILDWSYLIFRGDPNLRHSLGFFGAIGPAGIAILCMVAANAFYRRRLDCKERSKLSPNRAKALSLAYIIVFTSPAALSIVSPHSLRASASFPFWACLATIAVVDLFAIFNQKMVFWALFALLSYSTITISSYTLGGLRLQGYKQLLAPMDSISSYPGSSRGHFGYSEYVRANNMSNNQICSRSRMYYDADNGFKLFPNADSIDAARTLYIAFSRGIFMSCFKA